jgi:hypothetical protein
LTSVDVDEASDVVPVVPLTWLAPPVVALGLPLVADGDSTAVEVELTEGSVCSSSTLSDHFAPLSSDFNAGTVVCSFAGVMAPDVGLLDVAEAEFDAPRAACAYEKGAGAADLTMSPWEDDIFSKYYDKVCLCLRSANSRLKSADCNHQSSGQL